MTDSDALTPEPHDDGPVAPAWVGDLLASLRADDPPIPDHVAARLTGALALLAAPPLAAPTRSTDSTDRTDTTDSTVTPIGAARTARHLRQDRQSGWGHRLMIGGAAAAAVVVLGTLSTIAVQRNSTDPVVPVAAGDVTGTVLTPSVSPAPPRYVMSGTDYTAANLTASTRALLVAAGMSRTELAVPPATTGPTPRVTTSQGAVEPTPATPASTMLKEASARPTAACLTALVGSPDVAPLVVDEASYDGKPAFVIVVVTPGAPETVDVWVVPPTCTTGADGMLTFLRTAR